MHLSGTGAAAELKALKEREKAAWEERVVVDSVKFQPHYGPKKLTQLDKLEGILEGPVLAKSLRIIHNAKLPSGKRTAPPVKAPVTLTVEPYATPVDFASTFKVCAPLACCAPVLSSHLPSLPLPPPCLPLPLSPHSLFPLPDV